MDYDNNELVNTRINTGIRIVDLSWERIFLNVVVESDYEDNLDMYLVRLNNISPDETDDDDNEKDAGEITLRYKSSLKINPQNREGNRYYFKLNLSAMEGKNFLENGRWRFATVFEGDTDIHLISATYDVAYTLKDLDKIYHYGKDKYSYNVYFDTYSIDSESLSLILNSRFMIENPNWKDRYIISDRRTFIGKLKCIRKKIKLAIINATYNIIEKTTKKEGKNILFMSETKPYLWGNLLYIDKRIKERNLDKEYKLSYKFRVAVGKNNGIKSWYQTISTIAKQDYIFVDDYAPIFNSLKLSDRTKLIQVWHAGEGFKSVGYSRFGIKGSPHPTNSGHKAYDYAITGSKRLVHVYSEVFGIPEEMILPLGMARMDGFLDEQTMSEKRTAFYAKYPDLQGKKLILFSPTFRGTGQKNAEYDYSKLDLKEIYDFCGDEYVWAFKMHPFIKQKPKIPKDLKSRIIDLSSYENINDLYYVTEIMITDYSSAFYEFAILKKPVLFYTYDRQAYELIRGVHKPVKETAPGKVCDTFEELMTALKNKDYDIEKTLQFREENYGQYDGKSADRIIDTIIIGKQS